MLGACLLLRRAMLDEIGGFDEGFPMYGEDIELQYRAARAGWERWYVPGAVADARLPARRRPHLPLAPHLVAPARHGAATCAGTPRRCCASDATSRARPLTLRYASRQYAMNAVARREGSRAACRTTT